MYQIDLSGRVAFVTGASSGLGAHFAKTLAAARAVMARLSQCSPLRPQSGVAPAVATTRSMRIV